MAAPSVPYTPAPVESTAVGSWDVPPVVDPDPKPTKAIPAKLTGEARLNAILLILQEKHGFHFPLTVFDPETDK